MNEKNYFVIVNNYNNDQSFEDLFLFGWSNDNDYFDSCISSCELLDDDNKILPLEFNSCVVIDDDLSIYISTELEIIEQTCRQLNGYDYNICKLTVTDDDILVEVVK